MFPKLRNPHLWGKFSFEKGWVLSNLTYEGLLRDLSNVWEDDGAYNLDRFLLAQEWIEKEMDWSFLDQDSEDWDWI